MATEDNTPNQLETDEDRGYGQSRVYAWLDDRLDLNDTFLGKAFPEDRYASFLLGETALFSFVTLVITGSFLGLFYTPGGESVKYSGAAAKYAGKSVPVAFQSVLRITYDIHMGFFTRMVHHWAAYIFMAAMGVHMLRVFFSGAYRNPRELNWLVGASILLLSLVEAFLGYALPYDAYGATATGIGFEMAGSIPVIGTALKHLVFGGAWPDNANAILPRMFMYHVFLIPAILAGLIGAHMFLLIRQKHTEQKSARDPEELDGIDQDDDSFVIGIPAVPNQAVVMLVVFLSLMGIICLLAGFFPVQRVAHWGPNNPTSTPGGVAPDWYFMWVFGTLKMISFLPLSRFIGGVLAPVIIIGVLLSWPFIDYSRDAEHFTADPIKRPMPTAVGVGAIAFIIMLSIDGMNEIVAGLVGVATGTVDLPLQILTVVVPILWALITYGVLKRGLKRNERHDTTTAAASTDD